MRIATWNVNSLRARQERIETWLAQSEPDVCCLQETKCDDGAFPTMAFAALGYESAHHGSGRWNGVAILSRVGLSDVQAGFSRPLGNPGGEEGSDEARLLSATCAGVHVSSLYVPNGRAVGSEHYAFKLAWLERLREELDQRWKPDEDVVLCGDFNIAPDDRDVWDPAQFVGATHVSEPERAEFNSLLAWGLVDAVRAVHEDENGPFTWWDYRAGAFHKGWGMRIDHVLVSAPLAARLSGAAVDREARKKGIKSPTSPSDHAPVFVDLTD